jgi:hypothetical protein
MLESVQHAPQEALQMSAVREQRFFTSFLATHSQFLKIKVPSFINLNLKAVGSDAVPDGGSTQVPQDPQVSGHASETPAYLQRMLVDFLSAQLQDLVILDPSLVNLILNALSTQEDVATGDAVGDAVGVPTGAAVGVPTGLAVGVPVGDAVGVPVGDAVGEVVGPSGDADGLGDGLMDEVGMFVGSSLGTELGAKEGISLGSELGKSLGT